MELLVDDVLLAISQLALRTPTEVLRFAVVCRRWARLVKKDARTLAFMTWHIPRISYDGPPGVFDHYKLLLAPKTLCRISLGPKTIHPGLRAICKVFRRRLMSLTVNCSEVQNGSGRFRYMCIPALLDAFRSYPLCGLKHLRIIQNARRGLPDPWCFSFLAFWVPSLEHLDLSGCDVLTDENMIGVFDLPRLRRLDLAGCIGLTDACFGALSLCTTLQHLDLRGTNVSQTGISDLGLLELEHLDLDFSQRDMLRPWPAAEHLYHCTVEKIRADRHGFTQRLLAEVRNQAAIPAGFLTLLSPAICETSDEQKEIVIRLAAETKGNLGPSAAFLELLRAGDSLAWVTADYLLHRYPQEDPVLRDPFVLDIEVAFEALQHVISWDRWFKGKPWLNITWASIAYSNWRRSSGPYYYRLG